MLPEEKEPEVEFIDNAEPEETPDSPSSVTVDLEKKPDQKPDEKPKTQETPRLPQDISKLHNTIAYQNRKLEQAMRKLEETQAQIASLRERNVPQAPQTQDEIDEIAQKDWKAGVKRVVLPDIEAKIQEAFEKREKAQAELAKRQASESELERSKQKVLQKYPTIEDAGSDEQRIYLEVINEDQSLLSNIHGPEIAMYRMEERLREAGRVPSAFKPAVDREVTRLARAGASSVVGRQASPNGKITLTKEQKEFCDQNNLDYGNYAKYLKAQDARGVEA